MSTARVVYQNIKPAEPRNHLIDDGLRRIWRRYIRNNGKDGSAWLQQLTDNGRLMDAMHNGVSAVASGTSSRGTKTSDTYSLSGFNDALAKIHAACNM